MKVGFVDPEILRFVVKSGCSYRQLYASDQVQHFMIVKGIPSCFFGASFKLFKILCFFSVFRSRSLQKRSGTCLNASGVVFASKLHMKMGKIIGKSISS